MKWRWIIRAGIIISAFAAAPAAPAGEVPDYGFEWATIGDVGNPAWQGGVDFKTMGRGRVDYLYRMSVLEVSSAQWLEFINLFAPQSDSPQTFLRPVHSALRPVNGQPGTYKLNPFVEHAGQVPVIGITWRDAAMYVNWLNNDKSTAWEAIESGAYDVSTFTQNPDGTYNDQSTHDPDAQFWIPTLDEWLKAVHWDPRKYGAGQGGWWLHPGMSDEPLKPGLPGEGQTTAGVGLGQGVFIVPLGAYPNVRSPWGLLDTSGGAGELLEDCVSNEFRVIDGAWAAADPFFAEVLDHIDHIAGVSPTFRFSNGLRIASVAPELSCHDLTNDETVNSLDLALFLNNWGKAGDGDFNQDLVVNGNDLASLLTNWGPCGHRP